MERHERLVAFERVTDLQWVAQGLGPSDRDGPQVFLEGSDSGHVVWLRILVEAPEDEKPGPQLDTSGLP